MATSKAPPPISKQDRADLSRILKKARAFKAYYQSKPGNVTGKKNAKKTS